MELNSQVRCEEPYHFHRVLVPRGSRKCRVWDWERHPEPQRGVVAPVVHPGQDGAPVCAPVDRGEPGAQESRVQGCRPTGLGLLSRRVPCQSHLLWPEGWLALPTVFWKESHLSGSICPQPPRLLSRQPSRLPLLGLRVTLGTVILCLFRNVLCFPQAQPVAQNMDQGR